jgi:hypothetical protein
LANLGAEGYTVLSYTVSGGTPQDLRALLRHLYDSAGIDGALLVGALPVPWFQVQNDYNTYGYAEWPVDLYYMDLDGDWQDSISYDGSWTPGSDGIFDAHTGAIEPEIYVGRLTPTGIGTDTVTLKNYFRKDNAYRRDSIALPHRAMVLVDDDWIPWAEGWADDVSQLYPDTMDFFAAEATRAALYRSRLDSGQAWVSLFAHSSPSLHQFTYNSGSSYDYYNASEYTSQDPPANFYNHFCCSFGRYTTSGYGGGRSIFNQRYGLGSIASAKTGSMLEFTTFYQSLAQGKNLGQAFRDWFTSIAEYGVTFDELCWHYGMTLLGDPFLRPTGHHLGVAGQAVTAAIPHRFKLFGVAPNPARDRAAVTLQTAAAGPVTVAAYNLAGQRVRTLVAATIEAGMHHWDWDLRDNSGRRLPAGTYVLRASAANGSATAKAIVIR